MLNLQRPAGAGDRDAGKPSRPAREDRRPPLIHTGHMANQAKMTITVTSQRGASRIGFSTKGRYISLPVNGIVADLARQPVQPTANALVFWQSVLAIVTTELPEAAG